MSDYTVTAFDQYGKDIEMSVTAESMHVDGEVLAFFVQGKNDYDQDLIVAYAPGHWASAKRD